ncbi:acyl-CoA N-acyltransferase [Stachybotrys elegans]|uniref:histone acetyltransferase n=1 Tax=Stachybotrys elegans TaxID=80388 RepID=A0A8K0T010_9HYPO|nr:acyl-CoA N-acyltransferase [Stachybotrys elegans]
MPLKRKRPQETPQPDQDQDPDQEPAATRRATRHTPVFPPVPPTYQPRPRPLAAVASPAQTSPPTPTVQTPVPIPRPPEQAARSHGRQPVPAQLYYPTASADSRPWPPAPRPAPPTAPPWSAPNNKGNAQSGVMGSIAAPSPNPRPSGLVAPEITYHVPQAYPGGRPPHSQLVRPHPPSAQPPRLNKPVQPMIPPVVTPVHPPKPPTLPAADKPPLRADRNIDKVVLGDLCFRTWYPSYYGKEVLGDSSNHPRGGSKDDGGKGNGGKAPPKKERDSHMVLEMLYVCPLCFKYSKEIVPWLGHVKGCQSRAVLPGRKVYVHPRGTRKVLVPTDAGKGAGPKKRRGDTGPRYTEQLVQDQGEWSIWEVDGEEDALFCQNLSLFAKLFLDNKSVFFDVSAFKYFLLVYTPPPGGLGDIPANAPPQVTGFFSKEKMSWDNNNLACILVFPPWQRRGLGALLMGASYEISRREGIIGGPEKPISDLGKKGYKRFWAGEIARWLLSIDTSGSEEVLVDVNECSQATWIVPEDCLHVLREMKVMEEAGRGQAKRRKVSSGEDQPAHPPKDGDGGERDQTPVEVSRVKVDKEAVRRYVASNRISLERTCDPKGFVEGYAIKTSQGEEEDGSEGSQK